MTQLLAAIKRFSGVNSDVSQIRATFVTCRLSSPATVVDTGNRYHSAGVSEAFYRRSYQIESRLFAHIILPLMRS